MTSNAGTEYINLKQAKYNRDIRTNKSGVQAVVSAVNAPVKNSAYKSSAGGNTVSAPVNDGYTAKDVIGLAAEELLRAAAARKKRVARERANAPKYVTKTVKAKQAFPISVIGYIVIFSVIAMFLVLGNSKINEATLRADNLKSEIASEMNRGEILNSYINQRNDAAYVEEYAINVLGMVKSTDVAKRYVSISGEDKVVVSSQSGNVSYADTGATLMLNSAD